MKRLILLVVLGFASTIASPAKAQVNVSINVGLQPKWGPSGYNHVDYYYLPDIESYYYVPTRQFIYYSGSQWIHSRSLPHKYKSYNLYSGRKYVINSPRPYINHNVYKVKYSRHNNWNGNKKYYSKKYHNDKHYRGRDNDKRHHDTKRSRDVDRIIRPRG